MAEAYLLVLGAHTRDRPAKSRAVLSSVCLDTGTKLHLVPTPEERPARSSAVSSPVCLNTKATSPYLMHLVPTPEERPAKKQCRFVLGVSKTPRRSVYLVPTPGERPAESSVVSSPACLNTKMTRDLAFTPKEKVSQRITLLLSGMYLHQGTWLSTAPSFLPT